MKVIYSAMAGVLACLALSAQAQSSASDSTLQQELKDFTQSQNVQPGAKNNWSAVAHTLGQRPFAAGADVCVDASQQEVGGRYVMTFDANKQPCRIYDLSFPTVASFLGLQNISKLPVQQFNSDDYLNWMHGNYDQVTSGVQAFRANFKSVNAPVANQADWMKGLKFKRANLMRLQASAGTSPTGLPNSFRASDLELGTKFSFSARERGELRKALQQNGPYNAFGMDPLAQLIENPNSILDHIQFVWNDLEKVFDVLIDGDFFPIYGPIALVDFGTPYKPAVQAMARSMVQDAIMRLVGFIEAPMNQRILSVALTDGFEFIEDIYTYQMNMMEMSLQTFGAKAGDGSVLNVTASRGIDLLFSTRTGFFNDYIQSIAQGQEYDWNKIEQLGRKARYAAEKARDISMNNRNSELALNAGCTTIPYGQYFAICQKDGQNTGVYSLLSETSVLFWSFGAPKIFNPGFPAEMLLKRATSRLLEAGLRIVRLPILDFLTDTLADQLKAYAMSGADDEAFLHASLLDQQHGGGLDLDNANVLKWLYLQNINPFMPKSQDSETTVVNTNRGQAPASFMGK